MCHFPALLQKHKQVIGEKRNARPSVIIRVRKLLITKQREFTLEWRSSPLGPPKR